MYGIKNSISFPIQNKQYDAGALIKLGLVAYKEGPMYSLTAKGTKICVKYDQYFGAAKKRTSRQLMGEGYGEMIKLYRSAFPAGKLPSGKPGRQNVKALENSFRWFFDTYDYTWDEVCNAVIMYVNEYKEKDYMYMKTSQYFICKSDKNKIKVSELADYCDMIKEGITLDIKEHFKEKVV